MEHMVEISPDRLGRFLCKKKNPCKARVSGTFDFGAKMEFNVSENGEPGTNLQKYFQKRVAWQSKVVMNRIC